MQALFEVPAGNDYAQAVALYLENGLIESMSDNRWSSNSIRICVMLTTVLYRAEGELAVAGTFNSTDAKTGA